MPIHILIGERTHGPARHRAEQLAQHLPHAQIHSLAGQGHLANMLAPEQLAQTLEARSNGEKHR
jgi:pimeloyl-ACP methyl ester carboxylesterase